MQAMTPGRWIGAGALLVVLGLAIAGTAPVLGTAAIARIVPQQTTGGVFVVLGWVLLAWGIHRFGRSE